MTALSGFAEGGLRVRRALRRHGAVGALKRAWSLREHDVWSALDLAGERPRPALPEGLVLRRGGADDVHLLEGLVHYRRGESLARLRMLDGRLHLVLDGGDLLFACWVFAGRTPVGAAPGGLLDLPDRVACLEDSMAAPAARGRGIAPAAWSTIADDLLDEGYAWLVTKVKAGNAASRRAVAKAGFREIAEAHVRRLGPRWHCAVEPYDDGLGAELARRLRR